LDSGLVNFNGFAFLDLSFIYKKNDFTEISKNLAKYRSENNFVFDLSK